MVLSNRRYFVKVLVASAIIMVAFFHLLAMDAGDLGDLPSNAEKILEKVQTLNKDLKSYVVSVRSYKGDLKQIEIQREGVPIPVMKIKTSELSYLNDFKLYCKLPVKTHTKVQEEKAPQGKQPSPVTNTFVLARLLNILDSFRPAIKKRKQFEDHYIYTLELVPKVQDEGSMLKVQLWVNSENWTVLQARTLSNSTEFMTTQFEYIKVDNRFWLPDRIMTRFPSNDEVIVNIRKEYQLNVSLSDRLFERP